MLGFSVEGPSEAKISCNDNGDGSAEVSYVPTVPGEYAIHVLCDKEDIPDSPFVSLISTAGAFDPSKVSVNSILSSRITIGYLSLIY